mmetsp:Transcript_3149/g.6184  ORF Transcript_3149/g.6184 Transcript_3149/m.6184 type:complete len:207 (+) Transcript_3149:120-740(+)
MSSYSSPPAQYSITKLRWCSVWNLENSVGRKGWSTQSSTASSTLTRFTLFRSTISSLFRVLMANWQRPLRPWPPVDPLSSTSLTVPTSPWPRFLGLVKWVALMEPSRFSTSAIAAQFGSCALWALRWMATAPSTDWNTSLASVNCDITPATWRTCFWFLPVGFLFLPPSSSSVTSPCTPTKNRTEPLLSNTGAMENMFQKAEPSLR